MSLPKLPQAEGRVFYDAAAYEPEWVSSQAAYTEDQMIAYAEAAVLAERERCAKIADEMDYWPDRPLARRIRAG